MSTSPSNDLIDQLSLDIANRKISLADALRVAFIKGHATTCWPDCDADE